MAIPITSAEASANSSNFLTDLAGRTAEDVARDMAQVVDLVSKVYLKSVIFVPAAGVSVSWNGQLWSDVEALFQAAGFTVQTVPGQNRCTISWT